MKKTSRLISLIIVLSMLVTLIPAAVFADEPPKYIDEQEVLEESISGGKFYLGSGMAKIDENGGSYLFRVKRNGDDLTAKTVKLVMLDTSASYGKDYTLKVYEGDGEVQNASESQSMFEYMMENQDEAVEYNNTTQMYETGELHPEDKSDEEVSPEAIQEVKEGTAEFASAILSIDKDKVTEAVDGAVKDNEDVKGSVKDVVIDSSTLLNPNGENSLKDLKSAYMGEESDRQPMTGGGGVNPLDSLNPGEVLGEINNILQSAYLELDFADGETEKIIEIDPIDDDKPMGDRQFIINLEPVSENAEVCGTYAGLSIEIIDDDGCEASKISISEPELHEENGFVKVEVIRTGGENQTVSAKLKTESDTAKMGEEFSEVDTVLAFPMGINKREVYIPASKDCDTEKRFKIYLDEFVGCEAGDIAEAYGIIGENAMPETEMATAEPIGFPTFEDLLANKGTQDMSLPGVSLNESNADLPPFPENVKMEKKLSPSVDIASYEERSHEYGEVILERNHEYVELVGKDAGKKRSRVRINYWNVTGSPSNYSWTTKTLFHTGVELTMSNFNSAHWTKLFSWKQGGGDAIEQAAWVGFHSNDTEHGKASAYMPFDVNSRFPSNFQVLFSREDGCGERRLRIRAVKPIKRLFFISPRPYSTIIDSKGAQHDYDFQDQSGQLVKADSFQGGRFNGSDIMSINGQVYFGETIDAKLPSVKVDSSFVDGGSVNVYPLKINHLQIVGINGKFYDNPGFANKYVYDNGRALKTTFDFDFIGTDLRKDIDAGNSPIKLNIPVITPDAGDGENRGTADAAGFYVKPICNRRKCTVKVYDDKSGIVTAKLVGKRVESGADPDLNNKGKRDHDDKGDYTIYEVYQGDYVVCTETINKGHENDYVASNPQVIHTSQNMKTQINPIQEIGNYYSVQAIMDGMEIYPSCSSKGNALKVKVLTSDLAKLDDTVDNSFLKDQAKKNHPDETVEENGYTIYTIAKDGDNGFTVGKTYQLKACFAKSGYAVLWNGNCGGAYLHTVSFDKNQNIIEIVVVKTQAQQKLANGQNANCGYSIQGEVYFSDEPFNGTGEPVPRVATGAIAVAPGAALRNANGIGDEEEPKDAFGVTDVDGDAKMSLIDPSLLIEGYKTMYMIEVNGQQYPQTITVNSKESDYQYYDKNGKPQTAKCRVIKAPTVIIPTIPTNAPFITNIVCYQNGNPSTGHIKMDGSETIFTVNTKNDNGEMKYTDTDGVEHTEHIKSIRVIVMDPNTRAEKFAISLVKDPKYPSTWSSLPMAFFSDSYNSYATGDKIYVECTTDRIVGNGKGNEVIDFTDEGKPITHVVEKEELQQTVYPASYTGFSFLEETHTPPVQQDLEAFSVDNILEATDGVNSAFEFPVIGKLGSTINHKGISFGIETDGDIVKVSFGATLVKTDELFKEDTDIFDNPIADDPETFFKNKDNEQYWLAHPKPVAGKKLTGNFSFYIGGYLQWQMNTISFKDYDFVGGGFLLGGKFDCRFTLYSIIVCVPVYFGLSVNCSALFAITFEEKEKMQSMTAMQSEEGALQKYIDANPAFTFDATFDFYVGAGIDHLIGVRAGGNFVLNMIFSPSVYTKHPGWNPFGVQGTLRPKIWIDLFIDTITVTLDDDWTAGFKKGYFKDKESGDSVKLSGSDEGWSYKLEQKPPINALSVWKNPKMSPNGLLSDPKSYVLKENGYDRANPQLINMNDGQILLVYVDKFDTNDNYTSVMYTILKNGEWTEPKRIDTVNANGMEYLPNLCDAGDKILVSWSARKSAKVPDNFDTAVLKEFDIYSTTIDKTTAEVGAIKRLTNDKRFNVSPTGVYDNTTGDMMVFFQTSDVGKDYITAYAPTTNDCRVAYKLFDGASSAWVEDRYFENEIPDNVNGMELAEVTGGLRFVNANIPEINANDPLISDFEAAAFDGFAAYAYTVDKDNNLDTNDDRSLYIQIYDTKEHKTHTPTEVRPINVAQSNPQLIQAGSDIYLFWVENRTIRYTKLTDYIEKTIKQNPDYHEEDSNFHIGEVDMENVDRSEQPNILAYNACTDANNNLYVTWPQAVVDEDGNKTGTEIFATARVSVYVPASETADGEGGYYSKWSAPVQLTNSGKDNDEQTMTIDKNNNMLVVNNEYELDPASDVYRPKKLKMVATMQKVTSKLVPVNATASDETPVAGDEVTVWVDVQNQGLVPSSGYKYSIHRKVNGVKDTVPLGQGEENSITSPSLTDSKEVTFNVTDPENETIEVSVIQGDTNEEQRFEFNVFKNAPDIVFSDTSVTQVGDDFVLKTTLTNEGNADTKEGTHIKCVWANKLFSKEKKVTEPYFDLPVNLAKGESVTIEETLNIPDEGFDGRLAHAYCEVLDAEGKSLSKAEPFEATRCYPRNLVVNGEKDDIIDMKVGQKLELTVTHSDEDLFKNCKWAFATSDGKSDIIGVTANGITAYEQGVATLNVTCIPYGGTKQVLVNVTKPRSISGGGSGGSGSGIGIAKYKITGPTSVPNGTFELLTKSATKGDNVIFTAVPNDGYEADYVSVTDANGNEVEVKYLENGKYTFEMPDSDVAIEVEFREINKTPSGSTPPFTDVKEGDWFYDAVKYVFDNELMNGTGDTTFEPLSEVTRGMFATVLFRDNGSIQADLVMPFTDVPEDEYYTEAVRWAAAAEVVNGTTETTFEPDKAITREEMAAMLYRYIQHKGGGFTGAWAFPLDFKDADQVSDWAYEAMCYLTMPSVGLINGMEDGSLAPKNNTNRAELATILMRYCQAK